MRRVTSIGLVIRHFHASVLQRPNSSSKSETRGTVGKRRTKERERWKGRRRLAKNLVHRSQLPTEIAIPTAFPALRSASMGRSCYFIVSQCNTAATPLLWMSETTASLYNLARYVRDCKAVWVNLYNANSKSRDA